MAAKWPLVLDSAGQPTELQSSDYINVGAQPSNVIYRAGQSSALTGTTTKTAVVSFTVPANTLSTNKCMCVEIVGRYTSVSTTHAVTLEVAYGGTVLWADTAGLIAANAADHPVHLRLYLYGNASTSAQRIAGYMAMGTPASAGTGIGDLAVAITGTTGFFTPIGGSASVASTSNQTFALNVTLSATTNTSFSVDYVVAYMAGEGTKGDTGATGAPGGVTSPVSALSTSGTVNIDCSLGNYFTLSPTGNVTSITFTNLPAAGAAQTIILLFTQAAITARTVAWPSSFKWAGGVAGVVSTGSSKKDVIAFTTFDQGTTWYASIANDFS